MTAASDPLWLMDDLRRRADYVNWQRQQRQQHILRSQLGFPPVVAPVPPNPCHSCAHYHGVAYGHHRSTRTVLVCGFHPSGWVGEDCPDRLVKAAQQ